jgi:alpha-ketoglutarate-dependent taurine dioxygenase
VASLAEDPQFHLALTLQPGDIEIIHNPTIFHARSDIHDGEVRRANFVSSSVLWVQRLAW